MAGKREMAANLLDRCAVLEPLAVFRSLLQRDLPILAYHRVLDIEPEDRFPFDPELVSATPAVFRRQMEYVARHFDPITFADLLAALDGARPLPARPLIVTFDDGYRDNYTEAFPILRQIGVPATFFVCTGSIGGDEPFWYDRIAYALFRAREGELVLPGSGRRFQLGDLSSRRAAAWEMVEVLKSMSDRERLRSLEQLGRRLDLEVRRDDRPLGDPMSWAQVCEMSAAGMEVASHSVTHPVLSQLDDSALQYELVESRRQLEAVLGSSVPVLSYPFGSPSDYDARVMAATRDAGYRLAASYVAGRNDPRVADPFELRRLHVERYTSMSLFASMLAVPQLFAS